MTSANKIAANQANAQFSTGPRTDRGKIVSSQNSTRHGFRSQTLRVAPQDQTEFKLFEAARRIEHIPIGATEEDWFRQLLQAAWSLHKISCAEADLQADPDAFLDPAKFSLLERYQRYRQSHQRSYERAQRHLRTLQTDRAIRSLAGNDGLFDLPISTDAIGYTVYVAKRSQQPPITFVSVQKTEPKGDETASLDPATLRKIHQLVSSASRTAAPDADGSGTTPR